MKQSKKPESHGLTASQSRYLYRQFLTLYLASEPARDEFAAIVKAHHKQLLTTNHPRKQTYHLANTKVKTSKLAPTTKPKTHVLLEAKLSIRTKVRGFLYKTRRRRRLVRFALVCVLVSGLQLAYPSDRTLPLARLDGNGFVGFNTHQQILSRFQDFDSRTLTVHTHTKNLTTSYTDLGVTLSPDRTLDQLTAYSTKQRLIPFSSLIVGNKSFAMSRNLSEDQITLFVRDVVAENNELPRDATISVDGTKITLNPSKPGYAYQQEYLQSLVLRSDLRHKAQLVFKPTVLPPNIDAANIANRVDRIQQRINTPMLVRAEGATITIDPLTIASWVEVVPKPEQHTVEFTFSRAKILDTLRGFPSQVDVQMQPAIVTMLNGVQAGRTQGTTGKILQLNELVDKVASNTSPNVETITAPVTTVIPSETFERRYSKDSAGLQNLLDYWTANHKGQYSIDVRAVTGRLQASANQHRLTPSAGVFRIYIAHSIYGRITAKSLNGSSQTTAGVNIDTCLDRMIRESNEACTNVLGDLIGWGASDDLLKTQGFYNTTLTYGASLTSASDTTEWMIKLLNASLTTRVHADTLANFMKRSDSRSGIPAGSSGIAVANRAGSSGRYKHDVGIVYHPKGTYVLSVLSEGSDFGQIADLAREIKKVMDQ